jgi:hypothetical protein
MEAAEPADQMRVLSVAESSERYLLKMFARQAVNA